MNLKILNTQGKELEQLKVSDEIFGVKTNESLVLQYLRVFMTNQRQGNSSTKTRADVKGSGKKPWQQKHTGRARVGSSRTPLWRHGGVSHGPQPKSWFLTMPKRMKRQALMQALSTKLASKHSYVVDKLAFDKVKTVRAIELLKSMNIAGKALVVYAGTNANLVKSAANVSNLTIKNVDSVNAFELLTNKNLIITKDAIIQLEKVLK